MKTTQLAIIAILSLAALSLYNLSVNMEPKNESMFNVWMDVHSKNYGDLD